MEATWTGLEAFWEYAVSGSNRLMEIESSIIAKLDEHTRHTCANFEMYLEYELEARAIRYGFG